MSAAVLREVLAVLDEVARLDEAQQERSRQWSALAKRARAGEDRVTLDRDRAQLDATVVDYGDVWERLRALRPKVARAVKEAGR